MKKTYNYVLHPNRNEFSFANPFSSMHVTTLEQGFKWAERLMKFNTQSDYVSFRADNGRKTYFVMRRNNKLVRDKT